MDKVRRKHTSRLSAMQIGIFLAQSNGTLSGKTFGEIAGAVRKHLNGQVISDAAIRQAIEATGIQVKRGWHRRSANRKDRLRVVARLLSVVIDRIETVTGMEKNTLLTPEDAVVLEQLARGCGESQEV